MPIAKVKIAPVEQWCDGPKNCNNPLVFKTVGMEVEIETTSMKVHPYKDNCDGKWWTLTKESAAQLRQLINLPVLPSAWTVCEHMLEMD